ncbi:hypothetical protein GCM10009087_02380 [Sphingomonas oligophenolica]|uniref:DUF4185 domain-containing protein n=1 Tax=Sphingomonas oligophenolica TaxID=301154 RepID=A0ABU9Y0V5_9SPHN
MRPHYMMASAGLALAVGVWAVGWQRVAAQTGAPGPVARYAMDVGTVSGIGGMGGGMGAGMSMMFGGGGGNVQHELNLRLGSSRGPDKGGPKADHFMPPAARLGKSVALETPVPTQGEMGDEQFQRPKGRLLIYWGCGPNAGKGQPVIIDFSRLAKGQVPPGLFSTSIPKDRGPSMANSRTFGRWPARDGKYVKGDSSVLGDHRIVANYAPDISFSLSQDFMAPLNARSHALPDGATSLGWTGISGATGYYAFVMAMKMGQRGDMGDMVWWSSSATQQFGGGLTDWLSPATVTRLIGQKAVMPPTQTSCTVPAEVKASGPDMMMGMLYAYGPQADFSYPPKPANPRAPWHLEWTSTVRYRSMQSWLITSPGGMMGAGAPQGDEREERAPPKKKKGGLFGGVLGGVIP